MENVITIHAVSCWSAPPPSFFAPTTRSVRVLSLLCEADRMANQLIYPEDFVLKFTQLGYLESVRGAASVINDASDRYKCSEGTTCPLALRFGSYLVCRKRRRRGRSNIMTTMKRPVICMQRSALPVLEGESAASKVAPETSLSVTVTMVPLLSGSFKTRLLNVKVTPVTPRSNLAIVTK